ncbi:thioredoxin-disulfide reductase [Hydrogenivirga sp. 128-5-R1-1]|uniref:thioredoxin-disulfide reductase n=1 Tax=Hydrogenivirga sp. 128-5-R1-1 TaxID=392423 RepID=UPI00015F18B3|nr:thioredoxin-disulfide reductase [Hydrogenivirga sp. 128-5-R1-1]EDP75527.1 Thioredoxin reductase [Hydrogenivirga sp. 128-5-R1-1]
MGDVEKVIIIGGACAGLTAAIYTARAKLNPLLFAGHMFGGQLMMTSEVENYPGFPEGIQGPELMEKFRQQAEKFGTRIVYENVIKVDFKSRPFRVWAGGEEYAAESVIVATGARPRMLGLESEAMLMGKGVSYCAVCDGAFYKDRDVVVVGGGDSAMEEALHLTHHAKSVTVIHRRDKLRASKIMQERAFENPKINFVWDSVVEDIYDVNEGRVTGVLIKNVKTKELSEIRCDGVFIAIGHEPNTDVFVGQLTLDSHGYIKVHDHVKTSVEGVFAAGDVHDHKYRQAITASAFGCMAALECERYLAEKGLV